MAISNLQLNVTANTARALADFNKFSRSLDNKFLISGLKLDFVRSALNQINRDFQRAIGEQGLASASSLRAAQNQAALLTQTFKAFSAESALAITNNIGTALNKVAVTAGGTLKDVQKTLLATPFISTRLSDDVRLGLSKGIMEFQKNFRRAGFGENFGQVAQQFLMGGRTTMQMVQSGNAMEMFLGSELIKRGAGVGEIASPEMRSRLLRDLVEDSALQEQLEIAARRTAGFRIVLEDLNTTLFNPESGVFGALRSVVDSAGKPTTMFDEVGRLVEQVFGDKGLFATLVKTIRDVFGGGDPMRPFIDAVQFMTRVFKSITDYFNTTAFRNVVQFVKDIVDRVVEVFTGIYQQIRGGGFSAEEITRTIGEIGESIRGYIRQFGEAIRGKDVTRESSFAGDILGTLVEEVGKTAVVLIKELFMTMVDKVPEIVTGVLPALNKGINGVLTEAFGSAGAAMVKFIAGFIPHPIGMIARASAVGDITGGGGSLGGMLAMGAGALLGPGALFGGARLGRGLFGGDQARMGLLTDLTRRTNMAEELYNSRMRQLYMPGAQRVPLSGLLSSFLSPRANRPKTLAEIGIGLPETAKAKELRERREALMAGKITSQTSMFNQSLQPEVSRKGVRPFVNPLGMIIGPETTMFEAIPGFFKQEKTRRESAIRGNRERNVREGMERYRSSLANYRAETSAFRFYNVPEYLTRDPIDFTAYDRPIGPQPHGANWAYAPEYGGIGGEYAPFMESSYTSPRERETQRRLAASDRYKRMYESGSLKRMSMRSSMARFGRGLGRFGMAGGFDLAGGAVVLGSQLLGGAVGGDAGQQISGVGTVLGSGLSGASTGAMIGSMIAPGVGTAAGAVIGGVIGGVAPLLDKGVRDGVGNFIDNLGQSFTTGWNNFSSWISESTSWAGKQLQDILKDALNGIITALNFAISAFTLLPRVIIGAVEFLFNKLPENIRPGWAQSTIDGLKSVSSFQIPTMYGGKDYYGPAMALEARMSGRKPMVVNDGEFVIPKDGFPILAGLVGENLRSTGVISPGSSQPIQVNVSLSVTANSVVANADELATALRDPVYKIIGDAWNEAYNAQRVHRNRP